MFCPLTDAHHGGDPDCSKIPVPRCPGVLLRFFLILRNNCIKIDLIDSFGPHKSNRKVLIIKSHLNKRMDSGMQVGWSGAGRKTKTSKNFSIFSDGRGWVWHKSNERERGKETDRHPPSPFFSTSCQPVGPAIVSSTMKKKDSWTRFGREITAFAAGKRLGREEEISRPRRCRICRHFHAFSRRPYGAMIGRRSLARKLAVNVTKKGIMARRRCLTKHPSFPPSRPSPAAIDDSVKNLEMSTVAVPGLLVRVRWVKATAKKKCGRRRNTSRDTNPKSLPLARSACLTEASGVGGG